MNKSDRHAVILRLVREREIATQEELAQALRELGYEVVQTTVSRDITELGLVKVRGASGRLVYAPAAGANGNRRQAQLAEAFKRWALSCESSGEPGRPDHAARLRRSARPGDRRRPPSARPGHPRGREHDPGRGARGSDGRRAWRGAPQRVPGRNRYRERKDEEMR